MKNVPNDWGRRSRRPPATPGMTGRPARWPSSWSDDGCPAHRLCLAHGLVRKVDPGSRPGQAFRDLAPETGPSGLILHDEGRSTAPSARSGGLDNGDSGPERRVYIQMRGIEQVRIGGELE